MYLDMKTLTASQVEDRNNFIDTYIHASNASSGSEDRRAHV